MIADVAMTTLACAAEVQFLLFSLSGFTEWVRVHASEPDFLLLILQDLYAGS